MSRFLRADPLSGGSGFPRPPRLKAKPMAGRQPRYGVEAMEKSRLESRFHRHCLDRTDQIIGA